MRVNGLVCATYAASHFLNPARISLASEWLCFLSYFSHVSPWLNLSGHGGGAIPTFMAKWSANTSAVLIISVVVALLVDDDLRCDSGWLPDFAEKSVASMRRLLETLSLTSEHKGLLLLIADGLGGEYEDMVQHMPPGK